ncbi:MAG: tripartite tricarboxylate transporter substrate binding protein [Sedimentibacter sp.]
MKTKYLRIILTVMLIGSLVGCTSNAPSNAEAEFKYPEKTLQVIVGWGAGGGTDVFARAIAQPASEIMEQTINVVNMSGASGAISGDYVVNQPSDGYTIWAEGSNYAINVALGKTPHDLSQYIPIARIQYDTGSLQVGENSEFKTIDELVSYAKEHPSEVTVGGTGAAGFDEVVIAKFEKAAGIDLKYVPFESGGDMHSAVLGGHIDAEFEEFGSTKNLIDAGSIKVLLAFTDKKIEDYPDVPISVDKGWNVTDGIWRGIFVKAGTSQEIVDYLSDVFGKAKDMDTYKAIEKDNMLDLRTGYMNSEEFAKFLEEDINGYKEILKELGYIK